MELKLQNISPNLIRAIIIGGIVLVVIVLAASLLAPKPGAIPEVSQTTPQDGQEQIIPVHSVLVTFSQDLTAQQQEDINFSTNPVATLKATWISAGTLELTPIEALGFSTQYTVQITYKRRAISNFSFKTLDTTAEQFNQDVQQQTEGDKLFSEQEIDWYTKNPWYAQLPIKNDYFEIVYEPNNDRFRIYIFAGPLDGFSTIDTRQKNALTMLKDTGVDLTHREVLYFIIYQ